MIRFCGWAILLLLGSLWLVNGEAVTVGQAVFEVNDRADAVDAAPGDGVCATAGGTCTLRAAIQETNVLAAEDTVKLPEGTYTITIPGAPDPSVIGGDLEITDDLIIAGAGPATTIVDGNRIDRVFSIEGVGQRVTIDGLAIINGKGGLPGAGGGAIFNAAHLTLNNVVISDNEAEFVGGAVLSANVVAASTLTISNSVIARNSAESPTGGGSGGGIWGAGRLMVVNSVLQENRTPGDGGAIDWIGSMSLTDTILSQNFAGFAGGGVLTADGDLAVVNTAIVNNAAGMGDGGGIAYYGNNTADYRNPDAGGKLTAIGSTISHNFAGRNGGGIYSEGVDGQVCIGDDPPGCVQPSRVSITNATVSGNHALGAGGGIFSYGEDRDGEHDCRPSLNECTDLSRVSLTNVTLTDNSASEGRHLVSHNLSTLLLTNSLMAGPPRACGGSGILQSGGHNIASDDTCALSAPGDRPGTHVLLGALADNGGATQTHAILPGSPAIDAGDPAFCPAADQRGVARPQDGDGDGAAICDVGAFEAEAAGPAPTASPSPAPTNAPASTPAAALPIRLPATGGRPE
jgi:hypothetical protein